MVADYDYYADFLDYDYLGDDLFGRIVKAVKKNKDSKKNPTDGNRGILAGSVQEDFEFPQELLDSLPALEDFDYEDFQSLKSCKFFLCSILIIYFSWCWIFCN